MQLHGPNEVFFIEGQAWVTEQDGKSIVGGNFGAGQRWLIADYSQLIGINAFAAWDQTANGNSYDGAGVGVEWLSDYLGITANAYIPWNSDRVKELAPGQAQIDQTFFTGTNLAFVALTPVEEQLLGGDIEVGSAIPRAEWLSVFGGVYHFDAEQGNDFTGVSGRIQMDFTNAVVNVTVSDDDRFGTTVNVAGELRVGDGRLNFAPRFRHLRNQMFDRVRRRSRIATLEYIAKSQELAINPATGLPFEFLHVDNSVADGGIGSFEDRFNELDDASNMPIADIILAYRGDSTTGGNFLDANNGLVLTDDQIVLGEGFDFLLETANFPGQPIPLPDFANGMGGNPTISGNGVGDLINLASNNQILGLNFVTPNGVNAISGNGITDVHIEQINTDFDLEGNLGPAETTGMGGGIVLTDVDGTATILNTGFGIENPASAGGIVIDNTDTADLMLLISNDNTEFPNLAITGGQVGIGLTADNSNIDAMINGIVNSGSNVGLSQNADSGGSVDLIVVDSTFTNSTTDNFAANIQDGATGSVLLTDVDLSNAGDDAIDILLGNTGEFMLALESVTGNGATGDGLVVTGDGASIFMGNATDSTFDDVLGNAIVLDFDGSNTTGTLLLDNTSGLNAGIDAINIRATDEAVAGLMLQDSTMFSGAEQDGLEIFNTDSTVIVSADSAANTPVDFSNFVNGNGLLSETSGAGATTSITFTDGASFDNVAMNNAMDAINITSNNGATTTLTGSAISGANAGDDGIQLNSDGGIINATITAAGSFAAAGQNSATGDGIDITNANGGLINLNLTGAAGGVIDFTGAMQNGLSALSMDANTITNLNFNSGADFSDAMNDAIAIGSLAGAVTNVTGTNMAGANVGNVAINLIADGTDSEIDIDFTGTNNFADAMSAGINSVNTAGGLIDVNIADANFSSTMPGTTLLNGGLFSMADGTDTVTNFTFNSGATFDNSSMDAIFLMSDNGAVTTLTGDGVTGNSAGDDGLEVNSDAGTTTINLSNSNFNMAGDNGLLVNANNASTFTGTFTDSTFNMASSEGISVSIDGSTGTLNLTRVDANMAGDIGLMVRTEDSLALGSSTLDVNLNTVNLNMATNDALQMRAFDGSTLNVSGTAVSGTNAGRDGINIDAQDSMVILDLQTDIDFSNNTRNGVILLGTNSDFSVTLNDANFSDDSQQVAGNGFLADIDEASTLTIDLDNATFENAAQDGVRLQARDGSTITGDLDDVQANGAGTDGVMLVAINDGGAASTITLNNMTNISANNAFNNGLSVLADGNGSDVTFGLTDGDFSFAGRNGAQFDLDNMATINGDTLRLLINDAGQRGITLPVDDGDALQVNADNGSILTLDITDGNLFNAFDDTEDYNLMGGSMANVVIDPTDATGAGDNGVEFNVIEGSTLNLTHIDSPISTTTLNSTVGSNGVLGTIDNATANLTFTNSDINSDGSASGDGINVTGTNAANFNLNLNNSDVNGWNDGMGGGNGIILNFTDSNAMLNLGGADLSGAGLDALSITAATGMSMLQTGSNVMVDLGDGAILSGAGSNAIFVDASGASTMVGVMGTNATGDNAGDDAINIMTDDGALAMLQLTGGGSFQNAGQNGAGSAVNLTATNGSGITAELSGTISADMILDGAADFGVNGSATGASSLQLILDRFSANNGGSGINLSASGLGSSINNSMITNGTIQDNGMTGDDDSFGIQITLDDQATAGSRAGQTAGITFSDLMIGSSDPVNPSMTQDHGIIMNVDGAAYLGAIFDSVFSNFNELGGLQANVNGDMSATDSALLVFTYDNGTISNNGGHGVELNALNSGDNPDPMNQSAGIIAGFANTDILLNSDAFAQPVDLLVNPLPNPAADVTDIGYGLVATADNNIITINFDNVNLANNEEGATLANAINGGAVNFNFANMTIFDPVDVCALGAGSFASVTLNGVTIDFGDNPANNSAAISMVATGGGQAVGNFTDVTILDVQAQAFAFLSDGSNMGTASNVTANFNNLMIDNVGHGVGLVDPKTGLALHALLQGVVSNGGEADINLTDVTITDSNPGSVTNVNALDMDATTGGTLNLTIDGFDIIGGVTTAQLNEGEIDVTVDGMNSVATLDFNDISIDDSNGRGINLEATNMGAFSIQQLNMISATNAAEEGFNLTGGILDNMDALNPTVVSLTNSNFNGAGATGVNIDVDVTGDTTFNLTSLSADGAGGAGFNIVLDAAGAGTQTLNMDALSAQNVTGGDGLNVNVSGLSATDQIDVSLTGTNGMNNFSGASGDGVNILLNGAVGSMGSVHVADVIANGVGGKGVDVNVTGGITVDMGSSFNNITAMNAGEEGLNITSDVASTITAIRGMNNNFDNAGQNGAFDGINIDIAAQSAPIVIEFTDTTANGATGGGVDINLTSIGGNSTITLDNVDATGAQSGDGLNVLANLQANANIDLTIGNGSDFSNSAQTGALIDINGIDSNNMINLSIDGLTVNNLFPNPFGPGGDGLNIEVNNGETVNFNDFANITANGNSFDGIDLSFANSTQVSFGAGNFESIVANNNQQHGVNVNVESGAVINPVMLDGVTLTGNGASGVGFNGLNVQVSGMNSSADLTFSGLSVSNTGGRGVNADVYDNGALILNLENSTVTNSGLEGIDINVGSINGVSPTDPPIVIIPGTFTGSLTGVDVSNSGQSLVFQANGIDLNVGGAGSVAEMTFDNTSSNTNDGNGIEIVVDTGADATIAVNNGTEASGNILGGFVLSADGGTTNLDFSSASGVAGDNTFDNNLGGPGFEIELTNGVTVNDLIVNASASGNVGDGVRIIANDGTGVVINGMFDISGDNLLVNGNTGNGLFVDFNDVGGTIDSFNLENATVSQNDLNQIFVRMTNMNLDNFILRDLTVSGDAMSGDGVRVELIDTMITNVSTPGNLQGFVVDGVVATINGGRGLNLIASDSDFNNMPGVADSGIAGGIITSSQFSGNGQAGAALTFRGEGVYDFNIFDNTGGILGFNNNTGRGLLIEVQDHATFTMAGNNPSDADPTTGSFYNNSISGNGGIGMHVVASEPNFTFTTDATGPRVDLELGDILRNPNILTGNTDAAMAIELLHDATGSFSIVNSVHEATVNGANTNFNGDGLAFRLANFAELESLNIDGTTAGVSLNNNAGSGLVTIVSGGATEQARLGTMSNLLVVNTTFEGNGIHGIDIRRTGTGLYGANAADDMIFLGLNGQGNTFVGNAQAGINILNVNAAAAPDPFRVEVVDNTFVNNQDGIVIIGQANAQFTGRLSDNDFNGQTQDGIRVTLQQQSALGDPDIVNNPMMDPFLMDGNQIFNSGRHGIFFDTNFSNPVQSNAFANVLIQESEFDGTRTRIEGSGQNGIRVIDNSGRSGGPIVSQNTYTVFATDIVDSGLSGIRFNNASAGGTQAPNGAHALVVGDPANVAAGRRDVVITNSGQDGIEVNVASTVGNSSTLTVNRTEITESGRDGINALVQGVGRLNTTLDLVDLMFNDRHGMEFNITSVSSPLLGPVSVTTMHGVRSNENMGRGLNALVHHDSTSGTNPTQSTSIWNIGTTARVNDPTALNEFILNAHEGIVIDMQAQGLDTRTVSTNAAGIQSQQNDDYDIVTNFGSGPGASTANGTHNDDATNSTTLIGRSTLHPNSNNSGTVTGHNNFPANPASRVRLTATVNLVNNNIFSNGGAQSFFTNDIGFQDGVSIGVGNNTRLNALIANNRFAGNFGDDINIFAQRSSNLDPANSVRNAGANPNGNNQSFLVLDPVAYADIVFGATDPTNMNSAFGNRGDSVRIGTIGTNTNQASERITGATGVFANNDPFKGTAQARRGVLLAGRVQPGAPINGFDADGNAGAFNGFFDFNLNDFIENGQQQFLANDFAGWIQIPVTPWPGPLPNGP